ncbi:MAG TPA: hypothetical protein VIK74_01230 [Parasegetibacter sp.]
MNSATSPYKDLKLPSAAIVQLYKNCLVIPDATGPAIAGGKVGKRAADSSVAEGEEASESSLQPATAASRDKIRFLGENRKGIVILVNYPDAVHMPDEHLQFITAVLNACQLNLGDVAIVNVNQYPSLDLSWLKNDLTANQILCFGIPSGKVAGISEEEDFRLFNTGSSVILNVPSIAQYMGAEGKLLKALLWNRLKQMFGL